MAELLGRARLRWKTAPTAIDPEEGFDAAPVAAAAPPAERALRAQIADEIAERQEFLQSMRAMGRAGDHEAKITGEIAERLRDLKDLDRLEAAK